MRQLRLVILAGIGILALSGVALVASLMDYVNHPTVALAHVPPVVGPGAPDPVDPVQQAAPPPLPETPVTSVPVQQPAAQAPDQRTAAAPAARQNQDTLAKLLQDLQRRHHPPR